MHEFRKKKKEFQLKNSFSQLRWQRMIFSPPPRTLGSWVCFLLETLILHFLCAVMTCVADHSVCLLSLSKDWSKMSPKYVLNFGIPSALPNFSARTRTKFVRIREFTILFWNRTAKITDTSDLNKKQLLYVYVTVILSCSLRFEGTWVLWPPNCSLQA